MIKKVMVIGNKNSYNLEYFVIEALNDLGYNTKFFGYSNIKSFLSRNLPRMMWTRSKIIRGLISPFYLKKVNDKLLDSIKEFNPDLVISIKGESILPKTIDSIKNRGIKIVLWFPDDPRFFNSLTKLIAPHYNIVFTYSQNAIKLYKKIGINNIYRLSFGCSHKLHHRDVWSNDTINKVLFVGTFTLQRYLFMRKLIKKGVPLDIYGSYWPKKVSGVRVNKGVYGDNYLKLMQKYKLVLNIHNNIDYGPNMRVFEATGSGTTLLTDNADDTSNFFEDNVEVLFYQNLNSAVKISKEFLNNPNVEISKNAYKKCHENYEYKNIIKELIRISEV